MKKHLPLILLILATIGSLFLICRLTLPQPLPPAQEEYLAVHFIDVGQADCALLSCGGEYMLIDGGNLADSVEVQRYLEWMGVERLELMVATHPHEDHIGSLASLLHNFETEMIWTTQITYSNYYVTSFLEAAKQESVPIVQPQLGQTFHLGSAEITMLGPVRTDYEDVNDLSLVLMVEFEDTRFLFTGDMEFLAEGHMLNYWGDDFDWKCDVLKVGHHGSYSSTSYRLLREVAPTWAVIPCGYQNEFGHPHDSTLSRLRDAEVTVFRMDRMRTVIAISNGRQLAFSWINSGYEPVIPN